MTRTVRDAAIMGAAMMGHDPKDFDLRRSARPDFEAMLTAISAARSSAFPGGNTRMDGMPTEIETLWTQGAEMLKDAGAELRDITLPHTKYALPHLFT